MSFNKISLYLYFVSEKTFPKNMSFIRYFFMLLCSYQSFFFFFNILQLIYFYLGFLNFSSFGYSYFLPRSDSQNNSHTKHWSTSFSLFLKRNSPAVSYILLLQLDSPSILLFWKGHVKDSIILKTIYLL